MLASNPIRQHRVRALMTPTRLTVAILCLLVLFSVVVSRVDRRRG